MYIGERKEHGFRNLELNGNRARDCFQILQTVTGFIPQSGCDRLRTGQNIPYGKMVPACGIPKEYFECLRQNDKLKDQRISQLTARLFQLTTR